MYLDVYYKSEKQIHAVIALTVLKSTVLLRDEQFVLQ